MIKNTTKLHLYLDPSLKETYIGLMECLRLNTDGKIYVENERARLTLRLALLKEKNGW